ncbi:Hypothetical predicted protein [Lecanosticta acicola]|uniref:Glycosyltransferase family 8 protein n=1 Tax=Lecanosticta acicola TaxID=111012 RepID=A0AAI8YXT2_9PEZI|nr:Hypothetical predicted protein [Lecanosticta acicola]
MSHFYNTKSLGKERTPSPVRENPRTQPISPTRERHGNWPALHWGPGQEEAMTYGSHSKRKRDWRRWSRAHERIVLAGALVLMGGWWVWKAGRLGRGLELEGYLDWNGDDDGGGGGRSPEGRRGGGQVNWSSFAYATYATDLQYLCSALMLLASLSALGTRASLLLLYPTHFDADPQAVRFLLQAETSYGVHLQPVEAPSVQTKPSSSSSTTWSASFTKLLAVNQTAYRRILLFDSDATILQTMDELFLLPETPVAMPRAYWNQMPEQQKVPQLTSALTLLQPSTAAFHRILAAIAERRETDYDMEILNSLYGSSALVLPHRPYTLLTGEFRLEDHSAYMGEGNTWDPKEVLGEAKYVHFSDFPLPKPWISMAMVDAGVLEAIRPKGKREREVWEWIYRDFRGRRKEVCGGDFAFHTFEKSEAMVQVASPSVQDGSTRVSDAVQVMVNTVVA